VFVVFVSHLILGLVFYCPGYFSVDSAFAFHVCGVSTLAISHAVCCSGCAAASLPVGIFFGSARPRFPFGFATRTRRTLYRAEDFAGILISALVPCESHPLLFSAWPCCSDLF
jgi:hypothetical protein